MTLKPLNQDEYGMAISSVYPFMRLGDDRPYRTVAKYLSFNHLQLAVDEETRNFYFIKTNLWSGGTPQKISIPSMLGLCAKWNYNSQKKPHSNFEEMVIEEDCEEIQMLRDYWAQYGSRDMGTYKASKYVDHKSEDMWPISDSALPLHQLSPASKAAIIPFPIDTDDDADNPPPFMLV